MYKEHPLANKLKDSSILDYHPKWTNSSQVKEHKENKKLTKDKPKITWETF